MGLPLQSAGGLIDGSLSPQRSPPPARQHLWWARPPGSRPAYLDHRRGQLVSVRRDSGPPHAQRGSGSCRPLAGGRGILSNGISCGSRGGPVPRPTVRSRAGGWGNWLRGRGPTGTNVRSRLRKFRRLKGGQRHRNAREAEVEPGTEEAPENLGPILRSEIPRRIWVAPARVGSNLRGAGCRPLGRLRFYGQGP